MAARGRSPTGSGRPPDLAGAAGRAVPVLYLGDVRRKLFRFWILLALAAIIATAGVLANSTATVIGAMIVAPLGIPIMG